MRSVVVSIGISSPFQRGPMSILCACASATTAVNCLRRQPRICSEVPRRHDREQDGSSAVRSSCQTQPTISWPMPERRSWRPGACRPVRPSSGCAISAASITCSRSKARIRTSNFSTTTGPRGRQRTICGKLRGSCWSNQSQPQGA